METDNSIEQQADLEKISECPGIILEDNTQPIEQIPTKEKKAKRILHFSDGDMVEFSSEDETDAPKTEAHVASIDPKTLNWMPWAWYQTVWVSSKLLDGCDFVGEALADFLGITSPKYQFEIDEYKRIKAMELQESAKQDLEMGGWSKQHQNNLITKNEVIVNE